MGKECIFPRKEIDKNDILCNSLIGDEIDSAIQVSEVNLPWIVNRHTKLLSEMRGNDLQKEMSKL